MSDKISTLAQWTAVSITALFLACGKKDLPQSGFIQIENNQVHYVMEGHGESVLLLHGGYLDLTMWEPQVAALVDSGFQVIRFSDLGHGQTKSSDEPITGHEIISSLLDSLAITSSHMVGLSWGAMLAVDFALQHPERVNKLILVSPGLAGWNYFIDSTAKQNYQQRQLAMAQSDTNMVIEYFQRNWTDGPKRQSHEVDVELRERIRNIIHMNLRNHWQRGWSELSPSGLDALERIGNPSLIVVGSLDANDILRIANIYDTKLPNSELVRFEGVAHTLTMEIPDEFNRAMISFLLAPSQ